MHAQSTVLKTFLRHNLYRHPQVMHNTSRARQVVRDLFACYLHDPQAMEPDEPVTPRTLPRTVADHIAGMTDRYAIREHERLMGTTLFP